MIVLYILMRTDMDSMNAGKGMAQANHAYGALKHHLRKDPTPEMLDMFHQWQKQTDQDFGTTITLGGSEHQIIRALDFAQGYLKGCVVAGWVIDPSYPISDGSVTHLMSMRTCAYVFGDQELCRKAVGHLNRHP